MMKSVGRKPAQTNAPYENWYERAKAPKDMAGWTFAGICLVISHEKEAETQLNFRNNWKLFVSKLIS